MVNKKPHIITAAAFIVLIVLGLACASVPEETPRETSGTVSLDRAIQMAARSIEGSVDVGLKIALLNFNSPSEQFSEYVLEELTSELVHGRKLVVVDRRELDLIRQEEEFQLSGEVSGESAQAIGQKLGAQLIVSGSLSVIGNVYRIRIRVLNVETAAIVASPSADISASEEKVIFLLDGKGPIQVNTSSRQTPAQTSSENINVSVYVAGAYYANDGTVCYWVDGVRTDLPVPAGASLPHSSYDGGSIAVSGGKVYVAGAYSNPFPYTTGCYWVDGVRTDLPVPTGAWSVNVNGIAVSGGKVYVIGYCSNNNGTTTGCYWIDGARTDLPVPNGIDGYVSSIAVSGGKVYVAGYYNYNDSSYTVCYWIDGVRTDLPVPNGTDGYVSGIAVSDGKVYVAGSYSGSILSTTVCYWIDGIRTDLPVPTDWGYTSGIAVSGGKVYVAGSYDRNNVSTACYWVDGVRTDLPVPTGTTDGETSGIAVSGGKVYVAGYYANPYYTACYWLDGVRTDMPVPTEATGVTSGIAVEG